VKILLTALLSVSACAALGAQMASGPDVGYKREPGVVSSALPAPLREIGFDQNLGQQLPLDTLVRDEAGRRVPIGNFFGPRPVVLIFSYYSCPMLCAQVLNGLASALAVISLEPGRDLEVVALSFDPRDSPSSATEKKGEYLRRYGRLGAAAASHFLTADAPAIARLTQAAGFRYAWDERTQQFAHPSGVIVLTPDGRLARYMFGIEYGPRDLRLALVEASEGRLGSAVDTLLLFCYHYDPMTGRYGFLIMRALRIAGIVTVLVLGSFVWYMFRRERQPAAGRTRRPFAYGTRSS
jgi:protein SCO1/2